MYYALGILAKDFQWLLIAAVTCCCLSPIVIAFTLVSAAGFGGRRQR